MRPELVPSEAYERVLEIETDTRKGAAFTLTQGDVQYLVTAKHLFDDGASPVVLVANRHILKQFGHPLPLRFEFLPVPEQADIAVTRLSNPITADLDLIPSTGGMIWSQTVWFLGFPHGLALETKMDDAPSRIAFVKRAVVSGAEELDGVRRLYLDGHNNSGFSGGPVIGFNSETDATHVYGVVASYFPEEQPVFVGPKQEANVLANAGIVIATEISHVMDAIMSSG